MNIKEYFERLKLHYEVKIDEKYNFEKQKINYHLS